VRLSQSVKIGLYGGSFDPVHFAHLIAAQDALEQCELDQVIFIPAAQSPLKSGAPRASGQGRLAMLRASVEDDPRFSVSDYELRQGGLNYTLHTVEFFQNNSPESTFYWIIGGDQLEKLAQWHAIERLASLVEFIVVDRSGYALSGVPPISGLRVRRCEGHRIGISSTELRARVQQGRSIDYFMPHKALVYLNEHALYRATDA